MLSVFDKTETSKELYFHLNNSFHLASPLCSPTYKISGLYAIYKKDVCMYVGQSKNLPSRISTHLTGRYEECDRVNVYFVCYDSYEDFYERNSSSQKEILENNERALINHLKPIENLLVDRDKKVDDDCLFDCLKNDCEFSSATSIEVFVSRFHITVTDKPSWECVDSIDTYLKEDYLAFLEATGSAS